MYLQHSIIVFAEMFVCLICILPKQSLPLRVPGGFSSDSVGGVLGDVGPDGDSQTV